MDMVSAIYAKTQSTNFIPLLHIDLPICNILHVKVIVHIYGKWNKHKLFSLIKKIIQIPDIWNATLWPNFNQ